MVNNFLEENFPKSNFLIDVISNFTLLENKIIAITLANKKYIDADNPSGDVIYKIPVSDIQKMLKIDGNSIYENLACAANLMTSKNIGIRNKSGKCFAFFCPIPYAKCEKGVFEIHYYEAIRDYILNATENFTKFKLGIILKFTSIYSYRLYEILKSYLYIGNKTFNLVELKLKLGIIEVPKNSKINKILSSDNSIDYDSLDIAQYDNKYSDFRNFRKKVLDKAIDEINKDSDIEVGYTLQRKGRCINSINFNIIKKDIIEMNDKTDNKDIKISPDTDEISKDVISIIMNIFDGDIDEIDAENIYKAAEGDINKIISASLVLKSSGSTIDNVPGFIITAIRKNYKLNSKCSREEHNDFNDFPQNDYDFDYIEKMIIDN